MIEVMKKLSGLAFLDIFEEYLERKELRFEKGLAGILLKGEGGVSSHVGILNLSKSASDSLLLLTRSL